MEKTIHVASGFDADAVEMHTQAADNAVADAIGVGEVRMIGVHSANSEVGAGVELVSPESGGGEGFFGEVLTEGVEESGIEDKDSGRSPSEGGQGSSLVFVGVCSGDQGSAAEDVELAGFFDFDHAFGGGVARAEDAERVGGE